VIPQLAEDLSLQFANALKEERARTVELIADLGGEQMIGPRLPIVKPLCTAALTDQAFPRRLDSHCRKLAPRFDPLRARTSWSPLLAERSVKAANRVNQGR
jgi:hypothetical protein